MLAKRFREDEVVETYNSDKRWMEYIRTEDLNDHW